MFLVPRNTFETKRFRLEDIARSNSTVEVMEREFSVDNLLVRIHFIIDVISVDRPCAMGM